ncbi:MAG: ABC transporter permease [Syntrophomonadaceae bacterium]|nr:ABC transporter permease [Syntrophomonadaceae bacterium]
MKRPTNTAEQLAPFVSIAGLLLIWEGAVRIFQVPQFILPAPSQVISAGYHIRNLLLYHTGVTLGEALGGLLLAIAIAFLMALLLHNINWLYGMIYPLLILSQTIPLVILAILLPLWLGWGIAPKIVIVVLVCFFPIVINLLNGLDEVDPDQLSLFHSMGASPLATFFMVKMPAALPAFFTGIPISATYSLMAAVISEWVGAQRGLGYFMTIKQKAFAIDEVLAAVLVICLLSYLLVKCTDGLEYWLVPWNRPNLPEEEWN